MKKRIWSFLIALFLAVSSVQVSIQAETDSSNLQTESIVLTEENRYNPEFYREPEVRYPVSKARAFEVTQEFETYILDELKNFKEQIDIYSYQIPRGEAIPAFFQIVNSHPELFYLGTRVECYSTSNGISQYFTVTYTDTPEAIRRQRRELEIAADQAASQADSSMSDVEKALVVHDYLVQLCEYDKERYDNKSVPDISHSAYGALVNKIAVCDGYGKAYKYIMQDKLGIPCVLVTSDSMNHAWNMIQIGGNWYHVDATWDDPVWDRIGRVVHKYFLLSDAAITNTAPGHSGWATDLKAGSTEYDGAFWSDVDSAICPYQGEWYYSQYQDDKVNLVKKSGLFTGEPGLVCMEPTWSAGENKYYQDSFMFLSKVNGQIYFNTNSAIKRLKADGTQENVYEPGLTEGQQIFWFTVRGDEFCYALQAPESNVKQTILTYKLPELELPEISGVTAENVTAVYDGTAKKISLNGAAESDIVWYAGEDGKFIKEQPELVDAGTYVVLYKVERTGYQTIYGSAELNIEKAVPKYTIPKGLTGYSGNPLVSVFLPSGFQWQTDRNTKLYREGIQKFLAKYMPADSKNYQSVADIEVEVTVKCPYAGSGHKYTSVVTKEPTETEKGERIKTCSVCGDVQTEEIPALKPEQQMPEYTVPTGLKGESGKTLGTVKLPEGFSWQSDPSTQLRKEGTHTWKVKYTPEDTEQYQTVTDIEVEVTVECPGHQYESEVTKKPTETEKGERVYTCTLCGDSYKEEIPMLRPGQQVPEYTVPTGLKGESGKTLGTVKLPEGFSWQSDPSTQLSREGTYVWKVKYTPEDTEQYQTVTDIEVEVTVECPGHQYESEVTKKPTETEKGERVYTCILCGDSYTEEIPMLRPGQQVPEYTVPTGLKGESGKTLGTVKLPEGFSWQSDPAAKLYKEGIYTWKVIYKPEDTQQYQTVTDIEVEVTVECPGHQYESEVTKKPTETEKGERVYTCILCGDSYKEEIPMLKPEQQVPEYTAPTGLKGESGKTLGTVKLPEGFSWQSDPSTELKKEGTHTWKVKYTPEDTEKYQIVMDIEVEVTVECPGHQYESEVTKKPTETEKGERVYTCTLCGDSYTEEIPMLRPGQQVPEYTVPTGLKGESGKTLGTVKLPEGFSWQSDPSTLLRKEGTHTWKVKYTPEDTEKYQIVMDIEVKVMVECPGHQYESEVTKKPTETEKGERIYTCTLCGDSYTEEIPMLKPGQQVPEYTVPTGLKGESGKTLGTVKLPEGFSWQSDPSTLLSREGTYVWKVIYTPEDTEKYQIVMDIEVEVTVKCPGHQYESEVTKKPTETEKGERINTCSLCGDTYTEELSVLAPARPGSVSGLKVKKNMADSLTFSWRPVKNVSYRLMLYQGKKLISTQYVAGSVRSYGGLKAATNYTLKVTPYRIADGTRIYAASTGELKTATAPSAVKLNAVKKSGKSKAKLTWKKVSGASGYEIFMKKGNGSYKKIKTISKGTAASFTKKGMKKGTYGFKIRAYKTVGRAKIRGGYSTVKKIKIR